MYIIKYISRIKIKNIILGLVSVTILILLLWCSIAEQNNMITITRVVNIQELESKKETTNTISIVGEEEIAEAREVLNLKEYETMPRKIEGYKVVGKIAIPKIKIEKYILEQTTEESLKLAVTKICGPEINRTGNFCIAGHNYGDTFGWISSLENGDIIEVTDTYNRTVNYGVYEIERVSPYDTSCLSQETSGEREITLVTCTLGAVKRVVVKAVELYD